MKILVFTIFISTSVFAKTCDEDTILKLIARTECQESNSPKGCHSLGFFEGTAAAGSLSLVSKTNKEAKMINDFLTEGHKYNKKMLADYKKVLEVYFEIKKKMPKPNFIAELGEGFSDRNYEFRMEEYKRYKAQIDADPRLRDNLFLKEMNAYGGGGANDVFQRTGGYVMAENPRFKIPGNDKALLGARYFVSGYAIMHSKLLYNKVAMANGFPKNVLPIDINAVKEWSAKARPKTSSFKTRAIKGGSLVGSAALIATSTVVARAQTSNCLKEEGISLTEDELETLTPSVSVRRGLLAKAPACEKIEITHDGLQNVLNKDLSPGMMKFLCKQEEILAKKQDENFDQKKALGFTDSSQCKKPWTIDTKWGTVTTAQNSQNGWHFPQFTADTSRATDILQRRIKDPVSSGEGVRVEPAAFCADAASSDDAQFSCQVAQGLNTMGQMAYLRSAICGDDTNFDESASRQQ